VIFFQEIGQWETTLLYSRANTKLWRSCRFSITHAWSKNRQQPADDKRKQPIKNRQPNQKTNPKVGIRKRI
jgi:hypothetical protein